MKRLTQSLLLLALLGGVAHADITSNLLERWRYDNNLVGDNSNGMTETAGTVTFSSAALPFTGAGTTHNAVVDATDAMDSDAAVTGITGACSYMFWFKTSYGNFTFLGHNDATAGNDGITFRVIAGTGMRVTFLDSSYTLNGSTAVDDGNWHHIALTSAGTDSSGVKLYVDGSLDVTGTGSSAVNNPDGTVETKASKAFEIDDLRVYNRELSGTDITEGYNYTADASGTVIPLIHYYRQQMRR